MEVTRLILLVVLLAYGVGPNVKIGGAFLQDVLLVTLVFLWLSLEDRKFLRVGPIDWLLAFPAIVVALTTLGKFVSGFAVSMEEVKNLLAMVKLYLVAKIVMVYLAGAAAHPERPSRLVRVFQWALAVQLIFVAGVALMQVVGWQPSLLQKLYTIDQFQSPELANFALVQETGRVTSIYSWANSLGVAAATYVLVLLFGGGTARHGTGIGRAVTIPAIVAGVLAVYLTQSRVSYLYLVAGLIVCVLLVRGSRAGATLLLVFGVVIVALMGSALRVLSSGAGGRAAELLTWVQSGVVPITLARRLATWSWMPGFLLSSPYWLVGMPTTTWINTVGTSTDNQYLGWLLRYGVVGLVLLSVWLVVLGRRLWAARRRLAEEQSALSALATVTAVVWILLAFVGVSQDTLFIYRLRELLFALLAAVLYQSASVRGLVPGDR